MDLSSDTEHITIDDYRHARLLLTSASLRRLHLRNCASLEFVDLKLPNLVYLHVENCPRLDMISFPDHLSWLWLECSGTKAGFLHGLPSGISHLTVDECPALKELPFLPHLHQLELSRPVMSRGEIVEDLLSYREAWAKQREATRHLM